MTAGPRRLVSASHRKFAGYEPSELTNWVINVSASGAATKIHYRLAGPGVAALYALLCDIAAEHSAQTAAARDEYLGADAVDREELQRRPC